jgi:hypothetical protein
LRCSERPAFYVEKPSLTWPSPSKAAFALFRRGPRDAKDSAALSELRHNLPRTLQDIPRSPTGPDGRFHPDVHYLAPPSRRRSRPRTAQSARSEAFFRRPIAFMAGMSSRPQTPSTDGRGLQTPRSASRAGEEGDSSASAAAAAAAKIAREQHDPGWSAPNSWGVVPPPPGSDGSAMHVPAVPMPAFLKPASSPLDPRDVDPDTFPMPRAMGMDGNRTASRWSVGQQSSTSHGRSSSVGGDSVFCTCDLDDIQEESSSVFSGLDTSRSSSVRGGTKRVSTGSSLHIGAGRCPACIRRSQHAAAYYSGVNASAAGGAGPPQALSAGHPSGALSSRSSSMRTARKPRKPRRKVQQQAGASRTVVAGRLYQGSERE